MRLPSTLLCWLVAVVIAGAPAFAQVPPAPEPALGVVDAGVTTTAPVTTAEDLRAQIAAAVAASPPTTSPPPPAVTAPVPAVPLPDMEPVSTTELLWPFVRTMVMLIVVVGLIYLTLGKGVGKLVQRQQANKRVKVIERTALDVKHSIYLVEIDGRELLLAGADGSVVLLVDDVKRPRSFADALKRPDPTPFTTPPSTTSSTAAREGA